MLYHELKNGIRLVHNQLRSDVAHIGIVVNAGSRDEEENQQGLAHFIEHLIFKGTKKRNNIQVLGRLENVGADLNAFTTKEDTSIYASIQAKYYSRAMELLSDIVFHSVFPNKEIEKEKAVVIDEINSYKDNPAEWILDEFDALLFHGHSLGRNILGTKQKLEGYSRTDVIRFHDANYLPHRIVVSSVSNLTSNRVIANLEKFFSEIPPQPDFHQRTTFSNYTPQQITQKYSRHQSHAVIGNIAYNAHDENRIPLAVLNNMLGGPAMNSRLNIALREKNGIAYNLESNYQSFSDTGMFNIYCGTDDALMPRALELIHKELSKFRETLLSNIALSTAKRQIKGQIAISLESHQSEMLANAKNMLVYGKVDPVHEIYRKIDNVTAEKLLEVANEIFDPSRLSTLIFNNQKHSK